MNLGREKVVKKPGTEIWAEKNCQYHDKSDGCCREDFHSVFPSGRPKHTLYHFPLVHLLEGFMPLLDRPDAPDNGLHVELPIRE